MRYWRILRRNSHFQIIYLVVIIGYANPKPQVAHGSQARTALLQRIPQADLNMSGILISQEEANVVGRQNFARGCGTI
jgi:hypothetical protein